MKVAIYHNPRCSKSRETLALLEAQGVEPVVIHYLETPPDAATIHRLLKQLGLSARDIIRTGESAYKELGLADGALSEDQLIEAIVAHPELLQRPIVVADERARIGRPPESVLEIVAP